MKRDSGEDEEVLAIIIIIILQRCLHEATEKAEPGDGDGHRDVDDSE